MRIYGRMVVYLESQKQFFLSIGNVFFKFILVIENMRFL